MWFEKLVGFQEKSPDQVRQNLLINGDQLISKVNGRAFQMGTLEIPSLRDLRNCKDVSDLPKSQLKVSEGIGDVQQLHTLSISNGAVFQAASQFNLLEMVSPSVTPESGIDGYESDLTQGPACAIACGAGTIFRNYFVKINGQTGQTHQHQIDCLDDIGKHLNNELFHLWEMQNGYAMLNQSGLLHINKELAKLNEAAYEELKGKLKVGIQKDTEVTFRDSGKIVTQIYCSALPVAYAHIESIYWDRFARLILEASYEATLLAALENYQKTDNNLVFLTLVGGGAFGNEPYWIIQSLKKVLDLFKHLPLDVRIVSYGRSNSALRSIVD
ncbi:MAG: hypothetical protein R8G66_19675 [Cytophagales bacterium]|nr:hypothetical protein [Cytophagales bacterium]